MRCSINNELDDNVRADLTKGENPVTWAPAFDESSCFRMQLSMGGKYLLKLNTGQRPITHKYNDEKI